MKWKPVSVLVSALMLAAIARAVPHHSFDAEFDRDRPLEITGTVTRVEWTNPHARIYIEAPDPDDPNGPLVIWDFELGPPNSLMRRGWTRNSLTSGHVVTITGFHSKSARFIGNARSVRLGDGREVFAGSSFDIEPPQ